MRAQHTPEILVRHMQASGTDIRAVVERLHATNASLLQTEQMLVRYSLTHTRLPTPLSHSNSRLPASLYSSLSTFTL